MPADALQSILLFLVIGVAFYFLAIRPQQKRAKEQQALTNNLEPGRRVMLSAGIVGTVEHIGERQMILEVAPDIEMTVYKAAVAKVLGPDDDEFEYADEEPAGAEAAGTEPTPVEDQPPAESQN